MQNIAIIFHSASGTTETVAEAINAGIESVGGIRSLKIKIIGQDIIEGRFANQALIDSIDDAAAIVFGSPTFMGNVSAQFKAFADATGDKWYHRRWADKLAYGFTVGGSEDGDRQNTLAYYQILARQHGMRWADIYMQSRTPTQQPSGLNVRAVDGVVSMEDIQRARRLGISLTQQLNLPDLMPALVP